jgi:hypothetical protein
MAFLFAKNAYFTGASGELVAPFKRSADQARAPT